MTRNKTRSKKIIRKLSVNKRNKQLSTTIPRKSLPVSLRFEPDLFVEVWVFKKKKK